MKIEDVLTLCKSGFTASQIVGLLKDDTVKDNTSTDNNDGEHNTENNGHVDMKNINDKLDNLTSLFHQMAVQQSTQSYHKPDDVDAIIASIINPPRKDDK